MYHIFFIHSSVDGHLGCFHVLAIVSSAATNTSRSLQERIPRHWRCSETRRQQLGLSRHESWPGIAHLLSFPKFPFLLLFSLSFSASVTLSSSSTPHTPQDFFVSPPPSPFLRMCSDHGQLLHMYLPFIHLKIAL